MSSTIAPHVQIEGQADILQEAANCFAESGYNATSIDDVARKLGCTKGRIYHFFASKADLFFGVYRLGMQMCFEGTQPLYDADEPAFTRLQKMAFSHAMTILNTLPYQCVVMEGVEIHMRGSTTPAQRETLVNLQGLRDQYADLFRDVMKQCKDNGDLDFDNLGIAVQVFFVSINSPIQWYKPREEETEADTENIARQLVAYALMGLGADRERIEV